MKVGQGLYQKSLESTLKAGGKEMKPNGASPDHGHDCEVGDKDLLGWEVQ